jgi:hypothetical protein
MQKPRWGVYSLYVVVYIGSSIKGRAFENVVSIKGVVFNLNCPLPKGMVSP